MKSFPVRFRVRFLFAVLLPAFAWSQPVQPVSTSLLVHRQTGAILGPVSPATFAAANGFSSGPGGPGGGGTVTDFSAGDLAGLFTTAEATTTTTPALTFSLVPAAANMVWAGPASGAAGASSYRLLVANDIPTLTIAKTAGLQAAIDAKEPVFAAGLSTQYFRGDKTFQTLDRAAVGLPLVDNTSDAAKPVSTATQTALNAKAPTGTTVGMGLLNLANPSAITFVRINADNSSTALPAANFKTALGLATVASSGSAADLSGNLAGNAATATALQTARTINGVPFDGTANISITAAAAAGTLTGTTLAPGVTASSLLSAAGGAFGSAAFTPASNYVTANAGIVASTKTKITYGANGLVLAGADATTADFADTTNKRFVSDAQLSVLAATSGTNTGDQTTVSGNAGSASVLATPRAINGVPFDGSAAITVPAAAGTLTGTTLAATVTGSALTGAAGGAFGTAAFQPSTAFLAAGGTAASATVLATPRNINGVPFDGSAAITVPAVGGAATSATVLATPRAINGVDFDGSAPITITAAAGTLTGATLAPGVTGSSLTGAAGGAFGTAAFQPSTAFLSAAGTAASATILATARTINGVSFNGSANITLPLQTTVTGNAGSATVLATPRAINGVNFDGSAPITVTAAAGTLTGTTLAATVTGSSLTGAAGGAFGTAAFQPSTAFLSAAGTAASATILATARTINGVSFNGSADISVPAGTTGTSLVLSGGLSANAVTVGGAASTARVINFVTNGVARWQMYANADAESTGDAGSNFVLTSHTDAGAGKMIVININRNTGFAAFGGGISAASTTASSSPTTGAFTVPGGVGVGGAINAGGAITSGANLQGANAVVTAAAATNRGVYWATGAVSRWTLFATADPETGSDAGSSFALYSSTDAGALKDRLLSASRVTGQISFDKAIMTPLGVDMGSATTYDKLLLYHGGNDKYGLGVIADGSIRQFISSGGSKHSWGTMNNSDGTTYTETASLSNTGAFAALRYDLSHVGITYGSTTNIDMAASGLLSVQLTGNVTFTTSNKVAGRTKKIMIWADASSRTMTFPAGWHFLGPKPTAIAAGKWSELTLTCYSTAEIDVTAVYLVEL